MDSSDTLISIEIVHLQITSFEFEDGSKGLLPKERASTHRYTKEAKHMQLVYRGVRYNAASTHVDVVDVPVTGQYRGSVIKFHYPAKLPAVKQILHLIYRGVAFDEVITTPTA
ncbi:DUF4278 domain-containing protein [Oculatella sp. FACHB-28]|nr:DUF4278 domain-containing protein [Oculatella sp. FACHB-28]